jgi:4'-phosphopantetheinyl transferase EntD
MMGNKKRPSNTLRRIPFADMESEFKCSRPTMQKYNFFLVYANINQNRQGLFVTVRT